MAVVGNHLIERLPELGRQHLPGQCASVSLVSGSALFERGQATAHAYLLKIGFVSLLMQIDHHPGLEIGMIGREGMLGAQLALGRTDNPLPALVRGSGLARQRGGADRRTGTQCRTQAKPAWIHPAATGPARRVGGLPAFPHDRPQVGALAADEPAPCRSGQPSHHARIAGFPARGAPGRRDHRGRRFAVTGPDPVPSRRSHGVQPRRPGSRGLQLLCGRPAGECRQAGLSRWWHAFAGLQSSPLAAAGRRGRSGLGLRRAGRRRGGPAWRSPPPVPHPTGPPRPCAAPASHDLPAPHRGSAASGPSLPSATPCGVRRPQATCTPEGGCAAQVAKQAHASGNTLGSVTARAVRRLG